MPTPWPCECQHPAGWLGHVPACNQRAAAGMKAVCGAGCHHPTTPPLYLTLPSHCPCSITDAAHLLSDVSGFAVAVLAAIWAKRRASAPFSFGYHRVEVGAAAGLGQLGHRSQQ